MRGGILIPALLAGCAAVRPHADSARPAVEGMAAPRYTAEGALIRPEGYLRWVLAGASLGLGYPEDGEKSGAATSRTSTSSRRPTTSTRGPESSPRRRSSSWPGTR